MLESISWGMFAHFGVNLAQIEVLKLAKGELEKRVFCGYQLLPTVGALVKLNW